MKLFLYLLNRAKEPASWAGLSGIAMAVGVSEPTYATVTTAIAGVSGLAAFFLKESGAA